MRKDHTRDYVTEAFRLYAAAGKPTYETARERMYQAELESRANMEPERAVLQAERATEQCTPLLLDIMAVEKTLDLLERGGKGYIVKAVDAVYFTAPSAPLRRGDISKRVRYHSLTCPTDERTVYRWLKEARMLCAAIRGLRIGKEDIKQFDISP